MNKHYTRTRELVLCRDNRCCRLCGSKKGVVCHHMTYRNYGNERPWELITLCGKCHKSEHRKNPNLISPQYVRSGYPSKIRWRALKIVNDSITERLMYVRLYGHQIDFLEKIALMRDTKPEKILQSLINNLRNATSIKDH